MDRDFESTIKVNYIKCDVFMIILWFLEIWLEYEFYDLSWEILPIFVGSETIGDNFNRLSKQKLDRERLVVS